MTHQKPIQGFSAETTSGYEPCSVADTKTVWSLVPDILFKKIIGLRSKLGNTYYHINIMSNQECVYDIAASELSPFNLGFYFLSRLLIT